MNKHRLYIIAAIALPACAFAEGKDVVVKFDQLPAPVAKAVKAAAGDAKIQRLTHGDEDGKPAYEAVWMVKKTKHELTVADNGTVIANEQTIPFAEAPQAVQAAINKEAIGGKIGAVEKVEQGGKTLFEAEIQGAKGRLELKLTVKGKIIEREQGEEKD